MSKELRKEDLVVLDQGANQEVKLPQDFPCATAAEMAGRFTAGNLSAGELFMLGLHVADEDMMHEPGCPAHDTQLREQIIMTVRQQDADSIETEAE